ncbi:MAG: hypothetical protein RLZZ116_2899, partial [Planctomycetota bacterium]
SKHQRQCPQPRPPMARVPADAGEAGICGTTCVRSRLAVFRLDSHATRSADFVCGHSLQADFDVPNHQRGAAAAATADGTSARRCRRSRNPRNHVREESTFRLPFGLLKQPVPQTSSAGTHCKRTSTYPTTRGSGRSRDRSNHESGRSRRNLPFAYPVGTLASHPPRFAESASYPSPNPSAYPVPFPHG